jgi:hypothetical protein
MLDKILNKPKPTSMGPTYCIQVDSTMMDDVGPTLRSGNSV